MADLFRLGRWERLWRGDRRLSLGAQFDKEDEAGSSGRDASRRIHETS